jgi:phosphatidylglycerol lysyltransferase
MKAIRKLINKIFGQNIPWRLILALLILALAIFFIRQEHNEVLQIKKLLLSASGPMVMAGLGITLIYILLQGAMYYFSFATIRSHMDYSSALLLFLRRNVVSIFVPGGGLSSMAFFTNELKRQNISLTQNYLASLTFIISGFATVVLIALPALVYLLLKQQVHGYEVFGFVFVIVVVALLIFLISSLFRKGWLYRMLHKFLPDYAMVIEDLVNQQFDKLNFIKVLVCSMAIEITGMMHLWIATKALGFTPTIEMAAIGYVVVVVLLTASPFMKGLGPVEFTLALVMKGYGFTTLAAISITFMFRFFEFWAVLIAGLLSFIMRKESILVRLFPPIFLMVLGLVNIFSVLTPPIADRLDFLQNYLPEDAISASNYLVIVIGVILILLSVFLFRGLYNAWIAALALAVLSLIGNITKAFDYEEALLACFTIIILLTTRKQYFMRSDPKLRRTGIFTALSLLFGVLVYGIIGFYYLDKRHFNIDFSLFESVKSTLSCFLLMTNGGLEPHTAFGKGFLYSINGAGTVALIFLIYTMVRPFTRRSRKEAVDEKNLALELVNKYGNSPLDYFKTYFDKTFFFSTEKESFVSYRVAGDYAVVLDNPVAPNEEKMVKIICEFEGYCKMSNLDAVYYRVSEEGIKVHQTLGKRTMLIGQEAVLDLQTFNLDGGEKKPMRNALNKVEKSGFTSKVYEPPLKEGLIQKLKLVSEEWLDSGKDEELFSQGMFLWNELKMQTVITVENAEEKVVAFINIIPDFAKNEGTYDMQRKLNDAPNGVMDFVLVKMFEYFKTQGIRYVNLGLVPMSGIEKGKDIAESAIKFMYEQLPQFAHFKGLRDYKEKFNPSWHNKYLVYNHSYDLLKLPPALNKVMKP